MGKMSTSSVYIESELVEQLAKKGLSLSQVAQAAVKLVLSDDFEDIAVEMRMSMLDDRIRKLEVDLSELNFQVEVKMKQLEYMKKERERTEVEWKKARQTAVLTRYVRSLNQVIIASGYDQSLVKEMAGDTILLRRRIAIRPVSYYAFFKGWLLLSQPPGCYGLPTSFPT